MLFVLVTAMTSLATPPADPALTLTPAEASRWAALALHCIEREYPNKLDHVINDAGEVRSPRALHPAFYGCFDWHSSVHGHWMLVRLLKTLPGLPEAPAIRAALGRNLTVENLHAEAAYLGQKSRQSFERTYGWAWLLELAAELRSWNDPDGKHYAAAVAPLARAVAERYRDFLPKQNYPIRTGVHPNTAFGLAFALDWAEASSDRALAELVRERAQTYFGADASYPAAWEPGGEDFFSPALIEADLMRRVLPAERFAGWLERFLPGLARGEPRALFTPAVVTDRTDPKLVHLDGLNLSRAWCMFAIARSLPAGHPAARTLTEAARTHATAGLAHIASGDYAGEHWLASFAVYMLGEAARPQSLR